MSIDALIDLDSRHSSYATVSSGYIGSWMDLGGPAVVLHNLPPKLRLPNHAHHAPANEDLTGCGVSTMEWSLPYGNVEARESHPIHSQEV